VGSLTVRDAQAKAPAPPLCFQRVVGFGGAGDSPAGSLIGAAWHAKCWVSIVRGNGWAGRGTIYFGLLWLGGGAALHAGDAQQLALAVRAQTDFDRVERALETELPDAARCEQSEAAWLPVAPLAEIAAIHFRKGYCTLARAAITRRPQDFAAAAGEFRKSIEAWPAGDPVKARYERVSPTLLLLESIVRLEAEPGAAGRQRQQIGAAIDPPRCAGRLLPVNDCQSLAATGTQWLAWIDLQHDDPDRAAHDLSGQPDSPWSHWAAGKQDFRDHHYPAAAAQYGEAVTAWKRAQTETRSLAARLAPQPDWAAVLADWGGAQFLGGEVSEAIGTLDRAVKADPHRAWALYLRARAEEQSGQAEAALADYSLASRTALAAAQDLASGEAHFYRGILLYRRRDFTQAESEFSSALNFEIPETLRPDAAAWRHMAAVAGGACGASRALLEKSLGAVTPYFPMREARALAAGCPLTGSGI